MKIDYLIYHLPLYHLSLNKMSKNFTKQSLFYLLGSFILVLGIALILLWQADVAVLFRGGMGMVLALAGLLILYFLGRK